MGTKITLEDIVDMIATAVAEKIGGGEVAVADPAPAKKAPTRSTKKKADPEPEPEPEDDEDEDEGEAEFDADARTAELSKKRIATLKKMALDMGFDEEEVEGADKDTLIESIVDAEAEDAGVEPDEDEEESEDEDEAEEDEDEDEDELSREDLEAMNLTALKVAAKEAGYKPADYKGLDKESIIDLILGEGDEDEEEDDEDDEDFYSREELEDMSLAELKALCKDNGITVPRGAKAAALIDLLLGEDE